jgi:type VI secretion system secreted protein Hcp
MAVEDYFIKLDGIDGESTDSKHTKEVEVLSFHFKGQQQGTAGSSTGGLGKGKVKLADFVITKKVDKASPKLFLNCCNGEPVKKVVFTARKAGKDQQDYLKITMTDCLVSLFEYGADGIAPTSGAAADDWMQSEKVGFNYSSIDFSYKEQKPDGTLGGEIKGGWSAIQNKQL